MGIQKIKYNLLNQRKRITFVTYIKNLITFNNA